MYQLIHPTLYDNYDSESTDTYSVSNAYDGLRSVSNSGNLYTTGQCTYYAFDRRAELGNQLEVYGATLVTGHIQLIRLALM